MKNIIHSYIQRCIYLLSVIACLHDLNQAVRDKDIPAMLNSLNDPVLKLPVNAVDIDTNLLFILLQVSCVEH